MERLQELTEAQKWDEAVQYCSEIGVKPSYVHKLAWLSKETSSIELNDLTLLDDVDDPEWTTRALLALADDESVDDNILGTVLARADAVSDLWCLSFPRIDQLVHNADADQDDLAALCEEDEEVMHAVESRRRIASMHALALTYASIFDSHPTNSLARDDEEAWDIEPVVTSKSKSMPSHRLFDWIHASPATTAKDLAASVDERLFPFYRRHQSELYAQRWEVLESVPDWALPNFITLLKIAPDGSEDLPEQREQRWFETSPTFEPLAAQDLTRKLEGIVNRLADTGYIASARELAQTASSMGIRGLDEIGEELTLMERYVYRGLSDEGTSNSANENVQPMPLSQWRQMPARDKVTAYISLATAQSIVSDLRSLVIPFIEVEESRAEREGREEAGLVERMLTNLVLDWSETGRLDDFDKIYRVFDASKPTERTRLITSDKLLARLALAVTYGSSESNGELLEMQSKIFECLPAFPSAAATPSEPTSVFTIEPSSPRSVLSQVEGWDQATLSRALDTLDMHLSSAEILFRYDVPTALQAFLQSHDHVKEQLTMAQRMVRGESFDSEDEWETLIGDMLALRGEGTADEIKRPLWLVSEHKIWTIYLSALLRSSHFKLAQRLFRDSPLSANDCEKLVLDTSREFYDNAQEGNLHRGSMKEAFDVLSVVPLTPAIASERDFIEATSKLCSFRLPVSLVPIEIRLSKDRLAFFARILSSNEDAYKHPDLLLDLARKVGYRDDVDAQARLLAMMVDSAIQCTDYTNAYDLCERMITFGGASDVAWKSCYQLAKTNDYRDVNKRLALLGRAMLSCPKEQIMTLLTLWTSLEVRRSAPLEQEEGAIQGAARSIQSLFGGLASNRPTPISPTRANEQHRQQQEHAPHDASRLKPHQQQASPPFKSPTLIHAMETGRGATEGIRKGISTGFTRGVGWLIGADERELEP